MNDVGKSPASAPSATLTTFENQNQNTLNLVNSISMSAISSDSIAVSWEVPNLDYIYIIINNDANIYGT